MSKVLGARYTVGPMIGTGGMADVYSAHDDRLNRDVAIKILRSDLARDPAFVARFRKEALAAAGLNHAGIVAVYDSGEDGTDSYIVMELVKGKTLRELLQQGGVDTETALRFTAGILDALEYSHSKGIIHRDIKPGNIMITDAGEIKVMDFGIARALADIGATMTNTWNVVGTAQYLSPEQATGETADARSDIYSTGCVLYEMLSGEPPFTGDTPVSIAFQHVSGQLIPLTERAPDVDQGLGTICSVALSKDPAHRYQSAHAMLTDLKRAMKGEPVTTKIRRIKPRGNRVIFSLFAFILIAALAAIIGVSRSGSATIQVPSVIGLTEEQAKNLLHNFTINITQGPDARIPVGRVASQIPLATTKVPSGSSISIVISSGPGQTTVPVDLIGQALADARDSLLSAGLSVNQIVPVDSNQSPGTVLQVTPSPGTALAAGSGVVLQIASGSAVVPLVTSVSEVEAQTVLTQAGFLFTIIYAYDGTQAIGNVLAQAPSSGASQSIGSSVTITVNRQN
jgi:eukaryotic-like serine/threonine-protein kinase